MDTNKVGKKQTFSPNMQLNSLSKEELIAKIRTLEAHNTQLQNIINKSDRKEMKHQKGFNFSKCTYRHILLKFFYLGWNYQGFVVQEDTTETVEHYLFEALIKTCLIQDRASSNYNRCGRTDKGVSALSQTISINVRSKLEKENRDELDQEIDYCNILNRVLPETIRCFAWAPVPDDFSARFDCSGRTYKYFFPKGNLDIEKMAQASKYLIGTHDFRNFCKMDVGNGVVQFIRNILDFRIELLHGCYNDDNASKTYVAIIKGNAFLWHQIRYIMGLLLLIGEGKEVPSIILDLLDINKNPRKPDYHMASEISLNLFECEYADVAWCYSENNMVSVFETLRKIWTVKSMKINMINEMMIELHKKTGIKNHFKCLSEYLLPGVKPKKYVPVMKRPKCDSLEDKINQLRKKTKTDMEASSVIKE